MEANELTATTTLEELGVDSLDALQLINAVERTFTVGLTLAAVAETGNLQDLLRLIEAADDLSR